MGTMGIHIVIAMSSRLPQTLVTECNRRERCPVRVPLHLIGKRRYGSAFLMWKIFADFETTKFKMLLTSHCGLHDEVFIALTPQYGHRLRSFSVYSECMNLMKVS